MICQYCKKPLFKDFTNTSVGGAYDCNHCNITYFMRTNGRPYIISFHFKDDYQIDLDFDSYGPATRLFKKDIYPYDKFDLLLRLPHIIPIDPAQKDYWLHKLLNLKVFY